VTESVIGSRPTCWWILSSPRGHADSCGPCRFRASPIEVRSAGSEPAEQVNPVAVQAMREVGIDITANTPPKLDYDTAEASDVENPATSDSR